MRIKPTKSPAMLIVATMLSMYSIYSIAIALKYGYQAGFFWFAASSSGALGLALDMRWSQYIVYFLSLVMCYPFFYGVYLTVAHGRLLSPEVGWLGMIIAFSPAFIMAMVSITFSYGVFRHFRAGAA